MFKQDKNEKSDKITNPFTLTYGNNILRYELFFI